MILVSILAISSNSAKAMKLFLNKFLNIYNFISYLIVINMYDLPFLVCYIPIILIKQDIYYFFILQTFMSQNILINNFTICKWSFKDFQV